MDSDDRPTGRDPLSDKERLHEALEDAGYSAESLAALRKHGDLRPRVTLADGTEAVVQYIPPAPPKERVEGKFFRLVAEAIGLPVHPKQRAKILRELRQQGQGEPDVPHAVLSAYWTRGEAADARIANAAADPPDPHDEAAFRKFEHALFRAIRNALDWPFRLAVYGEEPEKKRPAPAMERAPETGEKRRVDPNSLADSLGDLVEGLASAARAAENVDALRAVAKKQELAYLDELDRLIDAGVPVEEARVAAGRAIGLDANATRQLRFRLRQKAAS